jgi:hypothetical protein
MAQNKVVAPPISIEQIETGKRLVQSLDQGGTLRVKAALWMFRPELGAYRLVLATPTVRVSGRRTAYKRIQTTLQKMHQPALLSDVEVVDSRDPWINLLKIAISTPPSALAGITFIGNVINGVTFPDSYIYRIS